MNVVQLKVIFVTLITLVICALLLHTYQHSKLCTVVFKDMVFSCGLTFTRKKTSIMVQTNTLRENLIHFQGISNIEKKIKNILENPNSKKLIQNTIIDKNKEKREIPQNKMMKAYKNITKADIHDEWLDRSDATPFSDYGDGTCDGDNDRKVNIEILQEWINRATKLNIIYFLTCGTLLGAWRNEDLIPKDGDLDILIGEEDAKRLAKTADQRNFIEGVDDKFHFVIQKDWEQPYYKRRRFGCNNTYGNSDRCSFLQPYARLIKGYHHMDIYDFKIKDGKVYDPSEFEKEFPLDDVFPLKKCKFMGFELKCPKKPRRILEKFYGKDLRPLETCRNSGWIRR